MEKAAISKKDCPRNVSSGDMILCPSPVGTGHWVAYAVSETETRDASWLFDLDVVAVFETKEEAILFLESVVPDFLELSFSPDLRRIWWKGEIFPEFPEKGEGGGK